MAASTLQVLDANRTLSYVRGDGAATSGDPFVPSNQLDATLNTGATKLMKLEDGAHASGDAGVMALGVQKAAPADVGADGDYAPLQVSNGRQWVSGPPYTTITVTMSPDTAIFASGDLIADTQVVTGALRVTGGHAVLESLVVIDQDDQKALIDIYFLAANTTMGAENAAPSISDAGALDILGKVTVAVADYKDLGGVSVASFHGATAPNIVCTGAATDIYVAIVNGTGTPTYTAAGIKLRCGFKQA